MWVAGTTMRELYTLGRDRAHDSSGPEPGHVCCARASTTRVCFTVPSVRACSWHRDLQSVCIRAFTPPAITLVIACVTAFPGPVVLRNLLHKRYSLCRYHQYKFIVDGEWRHDDTMPFMPDPLGNVNNWLYVRQPDAAGYVSSSSGRACVARIVLVAGDLVCYLQNRLTL